MKSTVKVIVILGLYCHVSAGNYVGWNDGISYRKSISSYIFEICTKPRFQSKQDDSEGFTNNKRISETSNFNWENSLFIGRYIFGVKNFMINTGLRFGHQYGWYEQKYEDNDENISRNWNEANIVEIGLLLSPSYLVLDKILLETDYGIRLARRYTNSKTESRSSSSERHELSNGKYDTYNLIGRSFSLNMNIKIYLKI